MLVALLAAVSLLALMLLPLFGTDFGKGAVRWFSLGFASFQPSEFLKPGFVVLCAWAMAAAQEPNGPPGISDADMQVPKSAVWASAGSAAASTTKATGRKTRG